MPPAPLILLVAMFAVAALPCLAQPAAPAPAKDTATLRAAALEVDKRMAAHFKKHNLPVPANADDATLLRRTYLVAVGRIPTLQESRAYLADTAPDKHALLVERLLASPGYASHMTNWLFDLLRVKDDFTGNVSAAPYVHYLRDAVADNKPWDDLAAELLTAEGEGWNGAPEVGYYVRDKGMPLDNTANTMRIFLGTRMECAQCHDHPFARWGRRDFYELAAFFHGIEAKNDSVQNEAANATRIKDREASPADRELYELVNTLGGSAHYFTVGGGGRGNIPLPQDYQYRDGKPGEVVPARAPYGPSMRMSARREGDDGRLRFVKWMVDADNPQFTQIIANRMWKRVMGRGLSEPVDEFVPPAQTMTPELALYLDTLMRQLHFDLRAFQHALLLTRSFRFDTNPRQAEGNSPDAFTGRPLQRLSAEQIWDSLLVLAAGNPDEALPRRTFGDAVVFRGKVIRPGALTMAKLQADLTGMKSAEDYVAYMRKLRDNTGGTSGESMAGTNTGKSPGGLARASELPFPPPGDHFLRRFGASDREVIEGSSKEGTVPQVLALLNGEVQSLLIANPAADLIKQLAAEGDDTARVRAMFLAVLTREPCAEELDFMLLQIEESGPERGWRNMLAALLCTHEFLFLR